MKAIVNTGPDRLEMQELPLPRPRKGQVRIRAGAVGICATDLQMIAGWNRTGFPAVPGHEWSGTVDAVGSGGDESLVGRRCVAENVWAGGGEVGFEHPGGYAECFLTEQANVRTIPEDFPFARAAMIEPLAVCVRAWTRLGGRADAPVLVFGDGPIGLLMTMVLAHAGVADTLLVGGREPRLALGRQLGAARTANYHELGEDLAGGLRRELKMRFPTVIEASGSGRAIDAAVELVRPCGKVLVLGDYAAARASFQWNDVLEREITMIGSNASAGAWPQAVDLAVRGALPLDDLITHRLPAAEFHQAIRLARHDRTAIKVVLEWPR